MKILRVPLEVADYQTISLPIRARVLHVAPCRSGAERIDLWYSDPAVSSARRDTGIYVIGTGNTLPDVLAANNHHLGTCVMSSHMVWHVFEGAVQ